MPGPVGPPGAAPPSSGAAPTGAAPAGAPPSGGAQQNAATQGAQTGAVQTGAVQTATVQPAAPQTAGISVPGCFRLDVRLNEIQFDYDPTAPGQITQDQLDLQDQLKKTEAALRSIFYPKGLPSDLRLRKPLGPTHPHHRAKPHAATVASVVSGQQVSAKYQQEDAADEDMLKATRRNTIKRLEAKKRQKFRSYFYDVYLLAELGVEGPKCQPLLARLSLTALKDRIVADEGGRVKNAYLGSLGIAGGYIGIVPFIFVVIREWNRYQAANPATITYNRVYEVLAVLCYAWVGAMIGTFLSYALRNPTLSFDQLTVPEEDRLNPLMRVIYVGLLTEVFMAALLLNAMTFNIGTIDTKHLLASPTLALLIGVFCGISERALGSKIVRSADTLGK